MHLTERELYMGLRGVRTIGLEALRENQRLVRAHATEVSLMTRISDLWAFRAWYRRQANWSVWMDLAERNRIELRALVAIARRARRIADEMPDPIDEYKGYTEAERAYSRG